MSRILTFLIVFSIGITLSAQELLIQPYNMDFEEGAPGQLPVGWDIPEYSLKAGYEAYLSETDPYQGKYCFELNMHGDYEEGMYGSVIQSIDARPYRGKKFRFRAAVRIEKDFPKGTAHLWVRTHVGDNQEVFFDMMEDDPIIISEWMVYEIEGYIADYTDKINYGLLMKSSGKAWIDAASFEIIPSDPELNAAPAELSKRELKNLQAFTKAYGYFRYFCPSSESRNLNWELYAYYGIKKILDARDDTQLINELRDYFTPYAPAIQFTSDNTEKYQYLLPKDTIGLSSISWIYKGLSSVFQDNFYPVDVHYPARSMEGAIIQRININPTAESIIKISVFAKTELVLPAGQAQIWLRFDDSEKKLIKAVRMDKNPIKNTDWQEVVLTDTIPENTASMSLGLVLIGDGKVWFDDVRISLVEENNENEIALRNSGFELDNPGPVLRAWVPIPMSERAGYEFFVTDETKNEGDNSLLIKTKERTFIDLPKPGETFTDQIAENIFVSLPISVYFTDNQTYPPGNHAQTIYDSSIKDYFVLNSEDRISRLTVLSLFYNILSNFYAFDNLKDNRDEIFNTAYKKGSLDKNNIEFLNTVEIIIANLDDSQARIWQGYEFPRYALPFLWEWTNGKLLITATDSSHTELMPGDEILEINSEPADGFLKKMEQYISGYDSWKRLRALAYLRTGEKNEKYQLKVKKYQGKVINIEAEKSLHISSLRKEQLPKFKMIEEDIYYFDAVRLTDKELLPFLGQMKKAKTVIIDLRGIAGISDHILGFFINKSVPSLEWLLPIYTKPNKRTISWNPVTNVIEPKEPPINAELFFLIDEKTQGYSEALAWIIKHHKLGKLIGSKTSGSPGELTTFFLPCDFMVSFCEIVVNDDNGKILNRRQIVPDVIVEESTEDIRNNKDAALDKALELSKK